MQNIKKDVSECVGHSLFAKARKDGVQVEEE